MKKQIELEQLQHEFEIEDEIEKAKQESMK
jgi:hypothetical protein